MLELLIIVTALIFALIAPIAALLKYYRPSEYNIWQNVFWIIVSIISWPLVPIVMATRKNDKLILGFFWGSFIILAIAVWYWSYLNIGKILEFQQFIKTGSTP